MFTIDVTARFCAAHALREYKGATEPLNEHEWIVRVQVASADVDTSGCAVDFHDVDRWLETIIAPFRGRCFNDIPPFDMISPSAENIAKYFYEQLEYTASKTVKLVSVTVCEDEHHCATYSR